MFCHAENIKLDKNIVKKPCSFILILIYIFIFGYIIFLRRLMITAEAHGINEVLVSIIFFFGAVFVVLVLKANHKLIQDLTKKSLHLMKLNKELKDKTNALKKSKEKHKKRSQELEETLDDFYTIRIGIQEQMKEGIFEEENRKIKKRLEKIKKGNNYCFNKLKNLSIHFLDLPISPGTSGIIPIPKPADVI